MLKGSALLITPFCSTLAEPLAADASTTAIICVSLQLCTAAGTVPNHTCPLPCDTPNPVPAMVTDVPPTPLAGDKVEIVGPVTSTDTPFDQTPFCSTSTTPERAPVEAVAVI
jgi:hypothetical protein